MRYVVRDEQGLIQSIHRDAVPGAEALPEQHPEVLAFMGSAEQQGFAHLDASLVRVLEDLIDALISRNVLRITDLPTVAQAKLFERKHFREGVQTHALELFGQDQSSLTATGQFASSPQAKGAPSHSTDWSDLMP